MGEFIHHISQLLLLLQNDSHELSLLLFVNSGNLLLRLLDLLLQLTLDQLLLHSRQLVTILNLPKLILLLLILLNLCSRLRLLLNLCQLEDHILSSLVLALRLQLDLLLPLFLLYSCVLPYPFDGLLEELDLLLELSLVGLHLLGINDLLLIELRLIFWNLRVDFGEIFGLKLNLPEDRGPLLSPGMPLEVMRGHIVVLRGCSGRDPLGSAYLVISELELFPLLTRDHNGDWIASP